MIGAGACGLTAVKALTDAGLSVQCFEKSDRVGGNWVFKNKNGQSSAYRSLHINTSRERMQFRDFPMPKDYPDYPKHDLIARYFQRLRGRLRARATDPLRDRGRTRRAARRRWLSADACPAARSKISTRWWSPTDITGIPPGRSRRSRVNFAGSSCTHTPTSIPDEPHALRGKRVLVVGMGNSAMDIACELGHPGVAEQVFLAARRGAWVLPKYAFGKPIDQNSLLPSFLPASVRRALAEALVSTGGRAPGGLRVCRSPITIWTKPIPRFRPTF